MDLNAIGGLVGQVGVPVTLVLFFVFWSRDRENKLGKRLDDVQDRQTELLRTVIVENTRALQGTSVALEKLTEQTTRNTETSMRIISTLDRMDNGNRPYDGHERREK